MMRGSNWILLDDSESVAFEVSKHTLDTAQFIVDALEYEPPEGFRVIQVKFKVDEHLTVAGTIEWHTMIIVERIRLRRIDD